MTADWDALTPEVMEIVDRAAVAVAREYSGITEVDDQKQEGYLLVASNADRAQNYMAVDGPSHLYRWVWSRLTDNLRTQANKSNRVVDIARLGSDL